MTPPSSEHPPSPTCDSPQRLVVDDRYASAHQDSRVLFVVLHYTEVDLPTSLRLLTRGHVSCHYLVSDEHPARVYRLVPEDKRAWHAGVSHWRGHAQLNASSIGIEIVNPGPLREPSGQGYAPYPEHQIETVVALVRDIVQRHAIRAEHVVGHSDIAPLRKTDPGPAFPWWRLAQEGLVVWPRDDDVARHRQEFETQLPAVAWFQQALTEVGYAVPSHGQLDDLTQACLRAFQMKYRPQCYDGQPDATTAALLQALVRSTPQPA